MTAAWVLVVNPTPGEPEAIAAVLELEGYRVARAGTGAGALWLAEQRPPNLVLLRPPLPDLTAHQLVQQLAALGRGVPIVLIGDAPELTHTAHAIGAVAVLAGSLPISTLLDVVARHTFAVSTNVP